MQERNHVILANEDLFYAYLKPFARCFKKGAIYAQKEEPNFSNKLSLDIGACSDLGRNIQVVAMTFYEAMPIP